MSWTDVELPPENEDERIRKEIINYILYKADGVSEEQEHSWIAYLEKQKEFQFDYPGIYFYDGEKLHFQGNPAMEERQEEQKPNIELIQRSWYMEGYHDGKFEMEPMWILETGEGGPRYKKNERYGQPLEQKSIEDAAKEATKDKESAKKFLKTAGIVDENGNLAEMYCSEQEPTEMDNEEIELSDFESELFSAFSDGWQQYLHGEEVDMAQWAKEHSAQLLNAAKLELKSAEWSEDYDEENIQTRFAFYTYKDDPSVLYLSNVFVEETSRNHGFGTRILRAAEKVAEVIGAITIRLKVKQDSPANAWYRKHGYGYIAFEDGYDWLEKTLEYMKPSKQEWSEEDEKNFYWISTRIQQANMTPEYSAKVYEILSWLKSLRPQSYWKQLSEKDILGRDKCYIAVRDSELSDEEKEWAFNFLKRCEPKSHWKPSEEQMNYLCAVVDEAKRKHNISVSGYPPARILESLYNDLKKL